MKARNARWWIALVAAVGAALLAACIGTSAFLLWRRRYWQEQRREAQGPQGTGDQVIHNLPVWICSAEVTVSPLLCFKHPSRMGVSKHATSCHACGNLSFGLAHVCS